MATFLCIGRGEVKKEIEELQSLLQGATQVIARMQYRITAHPVHFLISFYTFAF